jgi:hypothetical protein
MLGKCSTLIFKVIVFWVMGPCDLIGGYWGFDKDVCVHILTVCEDRSRMGLQEIHNNGSDCKVP